MEQDIDKWLEGLPQPGEGEFLLHFTDGNFKVFCVRELSWYEMMLIDCFSYRKKDDDSKYVSGEYRRREIFKKALVWASEFVGYTAEEGVVALNNQNIRYNKDEDILSKVHFTVLEKLWKQYQSQMELSLEEAKFLIDSATAYFGGEAQEVGAIHPLVIEIDMCLKFGALSREDIRNIPYSEMQKIQVILSARNSALNSRMLTTESKKLESKNPINEDRFLNTFSQADLEKTLPPHMRRK